LVNLKKMKEKCGKMNFFKAFDSNFMLLRRRKEFTINQIAGRKRTS